MGQSTWGFFARVEHAHMSLLLSTSTDSLVATGICKLASLPYEITTGASELTLKPAAGEEIQGSAVIDYLLTIASVVQGSEGSEQKQVTEWVDKDCSLEALDQHLALRVFIADGLAPTMADVKQFARLRESVVGCRCFSGPGVSWVSLSDRKGWAFSLTEQAKA